MRKFKLNLAMLFTVLLLSLSLIVQPISATSYNGLLGFGDLDIYEEDGKVAILSTAVVKINNISRQELFDFITDIENDPLYYPGITETILLEEGNSNLVGTKYVQRGEFAGQPFDTEIEITSGYNGWYITLKGSSDALAYVSIYTFTPTSTGAIFHTTAVVNGFGLTTESQEQFIEFSYNQLISVLGKTGTVSVPVLEQIGVV